MRAFGLTRAGAMRKLASFVDDVRPDALAICEIEPGDALSLATRFAMQWAYRGRQALFWGDAFSVRAVHDVYLPVRAARPFDRRGLLLVDAVRSGSACTLATTQISDERDARIPEVRFARSQLRDGVRNAIFFAHLQHREIGFNDLGFRDATPDEGDERIYVRGFAGARIIPHVARV